MPLWKSGDSSSLLDHTTLQREVLGLLPSNPLKLLGTFVSFPHEHKKELSTVRRTSTSASLNLSNRITRHSMNQMRRIPGSLEATERYHVRHGELRTPTPLLEASKYRRQVPHLLVEGGPLFAPVSEPVDPYRRFISVRQWHRQWAQESQTNTVNRSL
jgi:hypothetical protein